MSDQAWDDGGVKCLGVRFAGDLMNEVNERGDPIVGDTLMLLINAHWEEIEFTLPGTSAGQLWQSVIDTHLPEEEVPRVFEARQVYSLFGRTLALLRTVAPADAGKEVSPSQIDVLRKEAQRSMQPNSQEPPRIS